MRRFIVTFLFTAVMFEGAGLWMVSQSYYNPDSPYYRNFDTAAMLLLCIPFTAAFLLTMGYIHGFGGPDRNKPIKVVYQADRAWYEKDGIKVFPTTDPDVSLDPAGLMRNRWDERQAIIYVAHLVNGGHPGFAIDLYVTTNTLQEWYSFSLFKELVQNLRRSPSLRNGAGRRVQVYLDGIALDPLRPIHVQQGYKRVDI